MKRIAGIIAGAAVLAMAAAGPAVAGQLQDGIAAHQRQDYVRAVRLLRPLAEMGNARAQTYLGFMYEYGRGVPQSYVDAAIWYCLAAEQGLAYAQYLAGLLYDKGFGVRRDYIEAYKWLSLAAGQAPPRDRENWARMRDSVASKMTVEEIAIGQQRAVEFKPVRPVLKPVSVSKGPKREPAVSVDLK